MRASLFHIAALGLTTYYGVQAFPSQLSDALAGAATQQQGRSIGDCPFAKAKRQLPGVTPVFDAKLQYVSNQGAHKFVPPSSSDKRGPCPGLNAMANHGYLPHNGIGTITDFVQGCQAAFGMGVDLATFLAVYGAIFDGDLTSYSIGGPSPSLPLLGDLLGQPQGLSRSHNKYESDVSPVYGDVYVDGIDSFQMPQFKALYAAGQANGDNLDLDTLTEFRIQRWYESLATNPYFFSAPFSGVIVSPAAYSFIYRFMANKTAAEPEGVLDGETLKSFYAVTGDTPDDFVHTPGHEKFPDNWYKRHPLDDYTIPYFALDAVNMQLQHTEFLAIGGNTGTVNSFTGVDPANLTGGVYNTQNLLEGNNAVCFAVQAALQMAPDILKGLFGDIASALGLLEGVVGDVVRKLSCPQVDLPADGGDGGADNDEVFAKFPGFTKLKSGGTY